jgi:methionyl-tRNA synthetase
MSKSLGNVVDPDLLAGTFGADGLRYYLLSDISSGQDADFSIERLHTRYKSELADALGNLLNRTLNMTRRYCDGVIAIGRFDDATNAELRSAVASLTEKFHRPMEKWQINRALEELWSVITTCNRFVDRTEPFKLAKDPSQADRVASIMHHLCEALAHFSVYLEPVCPTAAAAIAAQLEWKRPPRFTFDDLKWGLLPEGHRVGKPTPLFPQVELDRQSTT